MKKIINILPITAFAVCLSMFAGCDSSPVGSRLNGTLDSLTLDRYDIAALQQNPGAIAAMPSNLTVNDLMEYDVRDRDQDLIENGVNIPRTVGENDWTLRPLSSGAIEIERRRYVYSRSSTSNTQATIEIAKSDRIDALRFDDGMLVLSQTGEGRPGSLSSMLTTLKYPINSAGIFNITTDEKDAIRRAVASLGYVAVDMPNAFGVGRGRLGDTVQVDVNNIVVLRSRTIEHIVDSTNQQLLDTGEITGTFFLRDTYYDLAMEAEIGDDSYRIIIARFPTFSNRLQVQDISPRANGNFRLRLNNLDNINPNP